MANGALQDFIRWLDDVGVRDVMLPFLLIFTIFFAILQKTKVLGEGKKNMNLAVALVIALIVVIPHVTNDYPSEDVDPVAIMNKALPNVSIVLIAAWSKRWPAPFSAANTSCLELPYPAG